MQNVPKNGFIMSQTGSVSNSASHSRRTSQKSGKSQTGSNNAPANPQFTKQKSQPGTKANIYSTAQASYNTAHGHSNTAGNGQLQNMIMSNNGIYSTHSHMSNSNANNVLRQSNQNNNLIDPNLRDSLQSNGGSFN